MKKYAVVVDISPSEQLNENDTELKFMALLFGLRSPKSFDEVGSNHPEVKHHYTLKKWSAGDAKYKRGFVEHAKVLSNVQLPHVILGINVASNGVIRDVGKRYWELLMGKISSP